MKVIDLKEAQTNLEQYAQECQSSPIVVTVDGKPAFEMLPVRTDDPEFVDRLIEGNGSFRKFVEERHTESDRGQVISLEEIRRRQA